ncbi:hypothetical protein MCOR25_005117 [Pyricularia grisea]|nr:hypothetical protein MCOR25_005117 [Pyricularia grisea]
MDPVGRRVQSHSVAGVDGHGRGALHMVRLDASTLILVICPLTRLLSADSRAILLLQPLDQAHRGVGPVDQVGVERNSGVACRCLSPTYSMTPTPPGTGTRGAYSLTTSFARLIRPKQFQIGLDVSDGVVDAAERVGQALGDVRMVDAGRVEFESSFITCPGYRVSQD